MTSVSPTWKYSQNWSVWLVSKSSPQGLISKISPPLITIHRWFKERCWPKIIISPSHIWWPWIIRVIIIIMGGLPIMVQDLEVKIPQNIAKIRGTISSKTQAILSLCLQQLPTAIIINSILQTIMVACRNNWRPFLLLGKTIKIVWLVKMGKKISQHNGNSSWPNVEELLALCNTAAAILTPRLSTVVELRKTMVCLLALDNRLCVECVEKLITNSNLHLLRALHRSSIATLPQLKRKNRHICSNLARCSIHPLHQPIMARLIIKLGKVWEPLWWHPAAQTKNLLLQTPQVGVSLTSRVWCSTSDTRALWVRVGRDEIRPHLSEITTIRAT